MSTSNEMDNPETVPSLAEFASELSGDIDGVASVPGVPLSQEVMPATGADFHPELAGFPVATQTGGAKGDVDNIVMDIPVTIKVVLGTARMPVAAVSKLARGTVIKLDNNVGDPVDIYVNGRFLARGQVVVLDEGGSRFGVTLTQVGGANGMKR